jgi:hypothetical protein
MLVHELLQWCASVCWTKLRTGFCHNLGKGWLYIGVLRSVYYRAPGMYCTVFQNGARKSCCGQNGQQSHSGEMVRSLVILCLPVYPVPVTLAKHFSLQGRSDISRRQTDRCVPTCIMNWSSDERLVLIALIDIAVPRLLWINVQKLTSLNLVVRTTIMTPVKYQNLRPRSFAKWASMCSSGSTHERLLSESGRSYLLAFLSVFVLLATVHIFQSHILNRTLNALNSFHNFQACRKKP